jgi:pimeloyl-ACP methyl ester carboxylesterase
MVAQLDLPDRAEPYRGRLGAEFEGEAMRGYPRNRLTDRPVNDPVTTKTTRSRGYTISFEDAGAGPAIVLIPGWTMSAADWRDAGYVDRLATSHRVLAVDPLGNGLSDKPHEPDAYGSPAVAADVVAVMDAAAVDRAAVWGYSRGARLAATVAVEWPDRVAALVLLAGGNLTHTRATDAAPSPMVEAMWRGDFGPLWDEFSFSDEDRLYDSEVNDPSALGAMKIEEERSAFVLDLGRVAGPAFVYVGGNDGPEDEKKTADALGVDLHVLPGLDHLTAFTRLDLVMPLVLGFLEPLGV